MHIDRSNYEIWFIDWLDGNLNSHQAERLEQFLEQNPDLREEFNDIASATIESPGISFRHKEYLKKSPSDISQSQFEYLCAAYLENDLADSQKAELLEITARYPDRKNTFDLILKIKIKGEQRAYRYKNLLLKRTTLQKALRVSVTSLSAAAAISLVIIVFSAIHRTSDLKPDIPPHNFVSDITVPGQSVVKVPERSLTENIPVPTEKKGEYRSVNINRKPNAASDYNKNIMAFALDPAIGKTDNQRISISKVPVLSGVDLVRGIVSDSLIASNRAILISDTEDERSKVGKFIAKTFREKFLREKSSADSPLKGFEIAEAGVAGLNKLFGWQMVLDTKNDADGHPRSVYFSSNILKVNAPVKKKEPGQ